MSGTLVISLGRCFPAADESHALQSSLLRNGSPASVRAYFRTLLQCKDSKTLRQNDETMIALMTGQNSLCG
jgi:hypothetical protein